MLQLEAEVYKRKATTCQTGHCYGGRHGPTSLLLVQGLEHQLFRALRAFNIIDIIVITRPRLAR